MYYFFLGPPLHLGSPLLLLLMILMDLQVSKSMFSILFLALPCISLSLSLSSRSSARLQPWTVPWIHLFHIYIYIYAFSRRFYPKRLTLHSSDSFYILSALAFPGNRTHDLGVANAMLYQLSYRKAFTQLWEALYMDARVITILY